MKILSTLIITLLLINTALTQSIFDSYNTSRFARPIGLGNSYIAVAEGVETTFYNSAGIAFIDYYGIAYSYGHGLQPIVESKPYDIGLTTPKIFNIGRFALSAHFLNMDDLNAKSSIYRLHYSRLISKNISVGSSINYYYQNYQFTPTIDNTSHAFDMSFSGLFIIPNFIFSGDKDLLKIGFQLNNVFSASFDKTDDVKVGAEGDYLIQYFGIGISYRYIPPWKKHNGFIPFSILFASDYIFDNSLHFDTYNFDKVNINFGIELKIIELLALRFGRENETNLNNENYSTPQFPVTRIGIGLEIPLIKYINSRNDITFIIDYASSDWQKQERIDQIANQFHPMAGKSDKYAFSIQVRANL
jgi:hypothetical protein